ncbi:MAG: NAD(P)H-dependent oxidoreductase [Candidatus Taylorbacteria bacterium]|nr:NAD(P)H-dependent oxidoreductase [Candidatus Taylorbacteria bacterium]
MSSLEWRYATKKFDTSKKVSKEDLGEILEAARLSPSSFGLQPWKFIIVKSPEIRQQIREVAYDQSQVTEASGLIVLAVNKKIDSAYIDEYIYDIAKTRGVSPNSLKGFSDMLKNSVSGRSTENLISWSSRQVFIALGIILETAALKNIDACPMEGFDPSKVDEILGLEKLGFASLAMVAVGYRSPEDASADYKKVRFTKEKAVMEV